MNDSEIIELYFQRDEQAIKETDSRYGGLCHHIAYNILNNKEDAEECVSDAYVGVWNAIPPARPDNFMAFISRITRNLSLKNWNLSPAISVQEICRSRSKSLKRSFRMKDV